MRSMPLLVLLLVAVGCEEGPAPTGTIHGRVTESVLGGAPDEHGMGVVTTTPIGCTVTISDAAGRHVRDVVTDANGELEVRVPVGHYRVSFEACGGEVCDQGAPHPRVVDVDVVRDRRADASWVCSWNAG